MTDTAYLQSLNADQTTLFQDLINGTWVTKKSCKNYLAYFYLAKRGDPTKKFPTSAGKFHNTTLLGSEIARLLMVNPIKFQVVLCDCCEKPVIPQDQAWSKDRSICIHQDCTEAWEIGHGVEFPYECDESDDDEESAPSLAGCTLAQFKEGCDFVEAKLTADGTEDILVLRSTLKHIYDTFGKALAAAN